MNLHSIVVWCKADERKVFVRCERQIFDIELWYSDPRIAVAAQGPLITSDNGSCQDLVRCSEGSDRQLKANTVKVMGGYESVRDTRVHGCPPCAGLERNRLCLASGPTPAPEGI